MPWVSMWSVLSGSVGFVAPGSQHYGNHQTEGPSSESSERHTPMITDCSDYLSPSFLISKFPELMESFIKPWKRAGCCGHTVLPRVFIIIRIDHKFSKVWSKLKYIYIYIYVYIYIYIYTHTHTHTHIYISSRYFSNNNPSSASK